MNWLMVGAERPPPTGSGTHPSQNLGWGRAYLPLLGLGLDTCRSAHKQSVVFRGGERANWFERMEMSNSAQLRSPGRP